MALVEIRNAANSDWVEASGRFDALDASLQWITPDEIDFYDGAAWQTAALVSEFDLFNTTDGINPAITFNTYFDSDGNTSFGLDGVNLSLRWEAWNRTCSGRAMTLAFSKQSFKYFSYTWSVLGQSIPDSHVDAELWIGLRDANTVKLAGKYNLYPNFSGVPIYASWVTKTIDISDLANNTNIIFDVDGTSRYSDYMNVLFQRIWLHN